MGTRRIATVVACALVMVGLPSLIPDTATAASQPPDPAVFVDPTAVTPDVAYSVGSGRVEIYTSIGDNDTKAQAQEDRKNLDWRAVNALAYLVKSVPTGDYTRLAIYNTYQDKYAAALNPDTNKWEVRDTTGVITETMSSITKALRDQLNNYSTPEERRAHIMAIGQRDSLLTSKANGSSLADLLLDSGVMKLCSKPAGACVSTYNGADMHSKFGLFSRTKDATGKVWSNVTTVTTANLNGTSGGRAANTMVVVYGDANLYNGVLSDVWEPMMAEKANSAYWDAATNGIKGSLDGVTFYPSPRAKVGGSMVDFEFNYLRSKMKKYGGPTKYSCKIRIVHSMFSTGRQGIGNALKALKAEGCSIQTVLDKDFVLILTKNYFAMSKWLGSIIGGIRYQNVHDKTMTMTYKTASGAYSYAAFTGSANFNAPGLTADESVIRINHETGVKAISAHADRMYSMAKYPAKIPVAGVSVSPTTATIAVDETTKLTAAVSPSNASVRTIQWSSSDTGVATVSSTGTVTAISPGTATITARTFSGGYAATAKITVISSSMIRQPVINSAPKSVAVGATATLKASYPKGDYDGTVQFEYLKPDDETWVSAGQVPVTGGQATFTYTAAANRIWRVKTVAITKPADAILTDDWLYSASVTVLARPAASGTPVLTGPERFASTASVTMAATWASPYAPGRPAELAVQYRNSAGAWVTKTTVTIASGSTVKEFALPMTSTHTWRVVPTSRAVPSGTTATPSAPVTLTTYGSALGATVPKPVLSAPSSVRKGATATFTATWTSPFPATYPAELALQYKNATGGWSTKTRLTIPAGSTSVKLAMKVLATHYWRLEVTTKAAPAGAERPVSATVRVTAK